MAQKKSTATKTMKPLTRAEKHGLAILLEQLESDVRVPFVMGRWYCYWEARKRTATKADEPYPATRLRRDARGFYSDLIIMGAVHEAALMKRRSDKGRSTYDIEILRLMSMFKDTDVPKRFTTDDLLAFAKGYHGQRMYVIQRSIDLREQAIAEAQSRNDGTQESSDDEEDE